MKVSRCLYLMCFICMLLSQRPAANNSTFKSGDVILGGLFLLHYSTENGECGTFFPIGLGHVQAMIFAIDRINNDTTLLPNVTLGYDIRDYCESPGKAMEHTYMFVRGNEIAGNTADSKTDVCPVSKNTTGQPLFNSVAAIIGPTDSGSAILVGSLLQFAGIPAISHSATSNELSSQEYRNVFRTAPPDEQQAIAMADIIQHFEWSYVAAVAMDDSYGRNGAWALESEAEKRGTFCLSFAEYIPRQNYKAKLERVVSKLKRLPNISVVVLWLFGGYARRFLKEAVKVGLNDRTWILSDALATEDTVFAGIENHASIIHGSLGVQPRYLDNKDFENFLIGLTSKSTAEIGVPWWREFWEVEGKLNCSKNAQLASKAFCKDTKTSLENTLRKTYDTYIPYVIDAVYAVANALHHMGNCSTKGVSQVGDGCEKLQNTVDPKELDKHLRGVNFEGLTGRVMFDKFGDPLASSYDIVHFQWDESRLEFPSKLVIGSWEKNRKSQLQIDATAIKWNTKTGEVPRSFCQEECPRGTIQSVTAPCCWECIKCPAGTVSPEENAQHCSECPLEQMPNEQGTQCEDLPEDVVNWSSLTSVSILVSSAIGLILVAVTTVILFKHRNTPLVKASNRELSIILLGTIAISFVGAILTLSKPTDFLCALSQCWRSVVMVTFISVLILKTMKILSAFQINVIAQRFRKFILNTRRQCSLVVLLVCGQVILLVLWFTLDPPLKARIIQPKLTVLLTCSLHSSSVGLGFQIAICIYVSILAVICTYYAFKARKLPENFNEARYIAFSMYALLLSAVAYVPLDIGVKGTQATVTVSAMSLLSSYGILVCMFGPKIFVILRQPEQNTAEAVNSQVSQYSFGGSTSRIGIGPASPRTTCAQSQSSGLISVRM